VGWLVFINYQKRLSWAGYFVLIARGVYRGLASFNKMPEAFIVGWLVLRNAKDVNRELASSNKMQRERERERDNKAHKNKAYNFYT